MGLFYKDANGNINTVDGSQTQLNILPTPSADLVGKIYQYIGNTTLTYINGWFYKCVQGETAGSYEWKEVKLYKQATDTSLGVVKPDGVTIVMDPDGTIHAMGGGKIKLGNVSGASVTSDKLTVSIRWTDPEDVVQGGIVFAKWAGTKIMKKVGSAPTGLDDEDAILLIDSTTRNTYSSVALTDSNVEYGETYYYKFFPYSEDEAVTSGSCLAVTPEKVVIENVPTQNGTLTYNGQAQTPSWTGYNSDALTLAVTAQTNVGTYTATFTPKSDYVWWDGTTAAKTASWSIGNIVIAAVPTQSGILSYTGSVQTPTWNGYDTDELTIAGDTSGTAIGTYTVTFTPKTNYEWYDGTTEGKTATWEISEAIITTVPTQQGTLTYDGTEQTAVWNNFNTNELTIVNGTGTNAGTYTASFTPKTNYKWSDDTTTAKTAEFVIGKAAGGVTLSANSVTLDEDHLTATVMTSNATGDISVSINDPSIATVSFANNTITINSQSERGVAVVTVSVASSANYNATTTTISVTGDFVTIKDWKDGQNQATDEELISMLAAADAGTLDLSLYWAIGDSRTVHLDALSSGKAILTWGVQDVIYTLMDTGINANYKDVNNKFVNYVVGQQNTTANSSRINYDRGRTAEGSWDQCDVRTDLNSIFYNAFPSEFKKCLKLFKVITINDTDTSANIVSEDYVSLFAEKEVFGVRGRGFEAEANALVQIEYYKTATNRRKHKSDNISNYYGWWLRSPANPISYKQFLYTAGSGDVQQKYADSTENLAPFICI